MAENNFEGDFDYGQVLEDIFNKRDLNFDVQHVDDKTIFLMPMSAKNTQSLKVQFYVFENGSAQLRSYLAREVEDYQREALLPVLNSLNNHYRYITLSIDSDGDVAAVYDFNFISEDEDVITRQALTTLYLVSNIMDKCIPKIMKVIWSTQEENDED